MAQSRLERIGTIFTRVSGLIRSGAMKAEDQPLWYDVYKAFPPKLEPLYARPAPDYIKIRDLYYADDISRAKFHKMNKQHETVNLLDSKTKTNAQNFVEIYNKLKSQGALDEEQIFSTALDLAEQQKQTQNEFPGREEVEKKDPISSAPRQSVSSNIDIKNLFH